MSHAHTPGSMSAYAMPTNPPPCQQPYTYLSHPPSSPMHTHRTATPHPPLQQRRMPDLTADAVIPPSISLATYGSRIVFEGRERGKRGGSGLWCFLRGTEGAGVGVGVGGVGEEAGEVEGVRAGEGEEGGFFCSNEILRDQRRKENLPSSKNASPHPLQHPGFTASGRFFTPSSPFPILSL